MKENPSVTVENKRAPRLVQYAEGQNSHVRKFDNKLKQLLLSMCAFDFTNCRSDSLECGFPGERGYSGVYNKNTLGIRM